MQFIGEKKNHTKTISQLSDWQTFKDFTAYSVGEAVGKQEMQNTVTVWKYMIIHSHLLLLLGILSQRYTGKNIKLHLHRLFILVLSVIAKARNSPNVR